MIIDHLALSNFVCKIIYELYFQIIILICYWKFKIVEYCCYCSISILVTVWHDVKKRLRLLRIWLSEQLTSSSSSSLDPPEKYLKILPPSPPTGQVPELTFPQLLQLTGHKLHPEEGGGGKCVTCVIFFCRARTLLDKNFIFLNFKLYRSIVV